MKTFRFSFSPILLAGALVLMTGCGSDQPTGDTGVIQSQRATESRPEREPEHPLENQQQNGEQAAEGEDAGSVRSFENASGGSYVDPDAENSGTGSTSQSQ